METFQFKNGFKLIYKYCDSNLSSFCIALNAGAAVEKSEYGLAHLVEHMVFKETDNRNENKINEELDDIFGFNNAMTNYPYVIYYGTTLCEDFERGIELYSDILLHPIFTEGGLKEERSIILEELKEWRDDPYQQCEDELFKNSFKTTRKKELIIGCEDKIKGFSLKDVKNFYYKFYNPENAVISVISSLPFQEIKNIIKKYFDNWNNKHHYLHNSIYEESKKGSFRTYKENLNSAKINIMYTIHDLSQRELVVLRVIDEFLTKGTSSLLYKIIRTEKNLVYDIGSNYKFERDLKLYILYLGTSKENINSAIELIKNTINSIKEGRYAIKKELIEKLHKRLKIRRELNFERCIVEAKEMATYQLMFGDYNILYKELEQIKEIKSEEIIFLIKKVFNDSTIQIISPVN